MGGGGIPRSKINIVVYFASTCFVTSLLRFHEHAEVDMQHEEEIEDVDDSYLDSEEEEEAKETTEASGAPKYGCSHYECRCAYISPCCNKVYVCRLCHDEKENHELNRFEVKEIVCLMCGEKQPVQKNCQKCEVEFGKYFCPICRLFDDKDKKQFHCDACGICRVGGKENFFHCDKCDMCLSTALKDDHKCVEKVSRSNCPVCMEDLHTSREGLSVLSCGHICHKICMSGMLKSGNYTCPLCCRSMVDMSSTWSHLDEEIERTPMPEEYKDTKHWVLCRDCHKTCETKFHVLGQKCLHCGSYNTCGAANPNARDEPSAPGQEGDAPEAH